MQLLRLLNVIAFAEKANGHMFYYLRRTSACYELYRRIIESHFPEEVTVQGSNKKMQKWLKADMDIRERLNKQKKEEKKTVGENG